MVRGGRRVWGTDILSGTFNGLYHYKGGWVSGLIDDWLIAYGGTAILKADKDGTFETLLSGLETDLHPSFCTLRGWLIMALGGDDFSRPYFWQGGMDEMKPLKNAPSTWLVASYANRLWCASRDYHQIGVVDG
jgi:hypothetical protein